jgi:hypothetical protein
MDDKKCICEAWNEDECGCGADWTNSRDYDRGLDKAIKILKSEIERCRKRIGRAVPGPSDGALVCYLMSLDNLIEDMNTAKKGTKCQMLTKK